MSVVRPEFGPTLAELVAPRVRALPRAGRLAFWALVAVLAVLVVLAAMRLARGDERAHVIVREPVAASARNGAAPSREATRPTAARPVRTAPVAPWWQRWPRIQSRRSWRS